MILFSGKQNGSNSIRELITTVTAAKTRQPKKLIRAVSNAIATIHSLTIHSQKWPSQNQNRTTVTFYIIINSTMGKNCSVAFI